MGIQLPELSCPPMGRKTYRLSGTMRSPLTSMLQSIRTAITLPSCSCSVQAGLTSLCAGRSSHLRAKVTDCGAKSAKQRTWSLMDMSADLNRWITWKLQFRLSDSSSGYLRLYKDSTLVKQYEGKTGGEEHYFKQGIYTQHTHTAKDARTYISNLKLVDNTGSTAEEPASVAV